MEGASNVISKYYKFMYVVCFDTYINGMHKITKSKFVGKLKSASKCSTE